MTQHSPRISPTVKQGEETSDRKPTLLPTQTVKAARQAAKEAYERVITRFRTLPESADRMKWPQMVSYNKRPRISPTTQYAVLTVLVEAADPNTLHVCSPLAVQEIMDSTSLSRGSVQRALAALAAGQLIERSRLAEHTPYTVTLTPRRAPLNPVALSYALRKEYQRTITNPAVLTAVLQQLERVVKRVRAGGSQSEETGV